MLVISDQESACRKLSRNQFTHFHRNPILHTGRRRHQSISPLRAKGLEPCQVCYNWAWSNEMRSQPRGNRSTVKTSDVRDPAYFHKVVDCQYACPAHTNVPEYIRLIPLKANTPKLTWSTRESNVFPAILGRTCDRPCEPSLPAAGVLPIAKTSPRGNRVAICRLKRVAATTFAAKSLYLLPKIPQHLKRKNASRLIGAGPASLTVAERSAACLATKSRCLKNRTKPGGLMPDNIPPLSVCRRRFTWTTETAGRRHP